ncbi:hypothetical protein Rhe02_76930 [Rhizocola hellebori]|uniref:Uncharacterized protein n=1 Tax=Rhizocola hellebori TaxID=1392758 RepID=A0A8J3VL35_9ACTN|nr:hypothetical protein [Rhizocola hellebori]GIH09626.1 hypothetical protein Rhe02_76930 [Rhizocola hellebori]
MKAWATVRRHWAILILLALAVVLRVLIMAAYQPAFWFYGDSGAFIESSIRSGLDPYDVGGLGYSVVLKVLKVTGSFAVVVALQHLLGLLTALAIYTFLYRRGVRIWLACLATAPLLFDSLQVTLEHYVLGETMFVALSVTAILLLLWPKKPGLVACALSGFVIMLAWFTRPSTIPMVIIMLGFLAIRRVGWRPLLAFAIAFAIPYVAVQSWIGDRPSAFGTSYANRALYARVSSFVDCDRLTLTEAERRLCPLEPLGQRHDRTDYYGWNGPAVQVPKNDNEILRTFARKAIAAQPADYAQVVLRDLAPHFIPGRHIGPESDCLREKWSLPATIKGTPVPLACTPALTQNTWDNEFADDKDAPAATGLSTFLAGYGKVMRTVPIVTSLALLLALVAAIRFRRGSRDAADTITLALITVSLVIPPVLVAMYEARYGLPALVFASMSAGLSWRHLSKAGSSHPAGDQPQVPATEPAGIA